MSRWRSACIFSTEPIRKAIQTIDQAAMQVALVVDKKGKLLGTVTDGDVRRGILKGVSLDETVKHIMKRNPIVSGVRDKRSDVLALMKKKQIHQIPIVNESGVVVGVEVLDTLLNPGSRENPVVIMAGGLGQRLRPLTKHLPKPLIEVGNRPILETIINNFKEYGLRHFYMCVNYKNEMVSDYFGDGSKWDVRIEYVHEEKQLGTAGALSLLPKLSPGPIFVINGDLLTKVNFDQLLQFHQASGAEATMCVREYTVKIPYGVVSLSQQRIEGIEEKPSHRFFVNAGIYVLDPPVLSLIPRNKRYDMTDLFGEMIRKSYDAAAFPIREYWVDVGQFDDLIRAQGEYKTIF